MSKDFFFVDPSKVGERFLTIDDDEAKHIVRVLRRSEGELVWVVDGVDRAYEAVIRSIDHHSIECEIVSVHERFNEPAIEVTLAVAVVKNTSRMEWLIEKGTELGVRRFIPMASSRSVAQSAREDRWKKIALAAMKQSGRSYLPQIYPMTELVSVMHHASVFGLKIIPYEQTDEALFIAEALRHRPKPTSALIVIGPEGGFTEEEIKSAEHEGFVQVSLGKRRLRTETAALVAAAWVIGNL
ncbi:MAG TPA: RsmE family RNA methyltransferase [Bacteroidota bacterium]|nr:RsmE family RNA methyltransferase [Bacteroidota bacterium]